MSSRTEPSVGAPAVRGLGQVEYRLARDAMIREYHRGRLSRIDICDAQAELLRVARNLGRATETPCPICEDAQLVNVSFAFGPRLPASGRAIGSGDELRAIARHQEDAAIYVVEVCLGCSWNHLVRMFSAGTLRRRLRR